MIRVTHNNALHASFSSFSVVVQLLSCVWIFATPWTAVHQAPPSFTVSWSLLKLKSIELVILFNHLILSCPILLLPSTFPSVRVFSYESALGIRWPKYWSFSFSIIPSKEYSGLISFRVDRFGLLSVQGTLKNILQHPQFKSINSSVLSLLYGPTFTCIYDYWENHSFNYGDLGWPSDVSVFEYSV